MKQQRKSNFLPVDSTMKPVEVVQWKMQAIESDSLSLKVPNSAKIIPSSRSIGDKANVYKLITPLSQLSKAISSFSSPALKVEEIKVGWVVKDASLLAKIRQVLSICFPINNKTAIYQVTVEEPTEILQINHLEGDFLHFEQYKTALLAYLKELSIVQSIETPS